MKRSSWRVLAYGAVLAAVTLPASAQVVIGGSNAPSVEVNWSVLDNLGRQPTLADMLKAEPPVSAPAVAAQPSASKGVQYRPYVSGAKPYAKTSKPAKAAKAAKAKPAKKSAVVPASAKVEPMADLVQSSHAVAKPAAPAMAGPQVSLPELPKPVAPAAALAKAEPAPVPAPVAKVEPAPAAKVEPAPVAKAEPAPVAKAAPTPAAPVAVVEPAPKAEPAPLPPAALTPPPLPAAPKVVEAAPVPQQVAALPPSPAPVAATSGFRGDTLTVPFSAESAHLSDSVHADLDRLAKRMLKDDGLGLQLLAYADGDEASASKARRLSLSRALEVRKYLMEKGLRSTRIEVRALGNKLEGSGSPDRVDAVLVNR